MMSDPSLDPERLRQDLSAVTDGEAEPAQLQRACEAWRSDARLRADWHAWAVIGDAMRSDDLAGDADHDAEFLVSLRAQLSREPVVLAPRPTVGARVSTAGGPAPVAILSTRRGVWGGSAAVAAVCMVVAGVGLMMRNDPGSAGRGLDLQAQATSSPKPDIVAVQDAIPGVAPGAASEITAEPAVSVDGQLLRNPELDRYLAAHRQFSQGPALAAPGGLRQVAVTPDGR